MTPQYSMTINDSANRNKKLIKIKLVPGIALFFYTSHHFVFLINNVYLKKVLENNINSYCARCCMIPRTPKFATTIMEKYVENFFNNFIILQSLIFRR